jgi:hypothetical protein
VRVLLRLFASALVLTALVGCDEQQVLYKIDSPEKIEPPAPRRAGVTMAPPVANPSAPAASLDTPVATRFLSPTNLTEALVTQALEGIEVPFPERYGAGEGPRPMRLGTWAFGAGSSAGELAVFHFGQGQGGSTRDNVQRWLRQFTAEDERPIVVRFEEEQREPLRVVRVTLQGTWTPPAMGDGTPPPPLAGAVMDALIIEGGPNGTIFLRWTGTAAVVQAESEIVAAIAAEARLVP